MFLLSISFRKRFIRDIIFKIARYFFGNFKKHFPRFYSLLGNVENLCVCIKLSQLKFKKRDNSFFVLPFSLLHTLLMIIKIINTSSIPLEIRCLRLRGVFKPACILLLLLTIIMELHSCSLVYSNCHHHT